MKNLMSRCLNPRKVQITKQIFRCGYINMFIVVVVVVVVSLGELIS